jgi:hypothetical protein
MNNKNSKSELISYCKQHNIKGYSGKSKSQLLEIIDASQKPIIIVTTTHEQNPSSVRTPSIDGPPQTTEPQIVVSKKTTKTKRESSKYTKITREDAIKSADEWCGPYESPIRSCLIEQILDPSQHRDVGKLLANPSEFIVDKILAEKSGRPIVRVGGVAYDGKTNDDKKCIRHQIKFRMGSWHLETTRRNSIKNAKTNSTGHVAYSKDEFDVLIIFIPGPTFGITGSKIRCIPVEALINPKKPDQLITQITSNIRKIYDSDEKTDEVIRTLYQI